MDLLGNILKICNLDLKRNSKQAQKSLVNSLQYRYPIIYNILKIDLILYKKKNYNMQMFGRDTVLSLGKPSHSDYNYIQFNQSSILHMNFEFHSKGLKIKYLIKVHELPLLLIHSNSLYEYSAQGF